VVRADDERLAIGHPERSRHVAIDRARRACACTAGRGRNEDLVDIVAGAGPRPPIGDPRSLGREERMRLELLMACDGAYGAGRDIDDVYLGAVVVPGVRRCDACESEGTAVR